MRSPISKRSAHEGKCPEAIGRRFETVETFDINNGWLLMGQASREFGNPLAARSKRLSAIKVLNNLVRPEKQAVRGGKSDLAAVSAGPVARL